MLNKQNLTNICYLFLLSITTTDKVLANELEDLIQESKELIQIFSDKIQVEYDKVVKEKNINNTVKVCKIIAHNIEDALSKDGWYIKRTSLKPKNPDNAPDQFEKKIIRDFEINKSSGWPINKMAYYKMT